MALLDSIDIGMVLTGFISTTFEYFKTGLLLMILFLVSYVIGFIISTVLRKLLSLKTVEDKVIQYGAASSKLWGSITHFISQYVKWYAVIFLIDVVLSQRTETATGITYSYQQLDSLVVFLGSIFWFLVLSIVGLMVGGMLSKIIRDFLATLGIDSELARKGFTDALGGIEISNLLANLLKWYVILLFIQQGIEKLSLPQLSAFMAQVLAYVPHATLGIIIVVISLLLGDFAGKRILASRAFMKEFFAPVIEFVVVYFGIVLALPKFGVPDVAILLDAFRILAAGLSLGLSIALGWGLKDTVAHLAQRYEKRL